MTELRSTAWWKDSKQDSNSRVHLKIEDSPAPHNPLHPYEHHQGSIAMQGRIVAQHHLLGEHGGSAASQSQDIQHVRSRISGHPAETQVQAAQHAVTAKLEKPANVQQTHQHDLPEKSPEPLDTQMQDLQHTMPERPDVPAVVPTQIPAKVESPAETQQTPQHIPPEKPEILVITQPQIIPPSSPEKPATTAVIHSQTPQSISTEKHEEPTGPQAQTVQQNAPEKSEKPVENQQTPQRSAFEKPVEARAQSDTQHVSS